MEGKDNTLIGHRNKSYTTRGVILGSSNIAMNRDAFVGGYNSLGYGERSVAIGTGAKAIGEGSIAMGGTYNYETARLNNDENDKDNRGGQAYAKGSIAIGMGTVAGKKPTYNDNGTPNDFSDDTYSVNHHTAVAIGYRSKATIGNALALGFNSISNHSNSVALGSKAETKEFKGIKSATINGVTYGNFAGAENKDLRGRELGNRGVVSIGKKDNEKQLVNVAAGEISENECNRYQFY